jgi:hypothetical protein
MWIVLWAVAAFVAGMLALAIVARREIGAQPALALPPGESLGSTALQRLARRYLWLGVGPVALAAAIVVWVSPQTFYERDAVRIVVTLLLVLGLFVLAGFAIQAGAWSRRRAGPLDERDREILEKAPRVEGGPMLVTLALWVVGLQQTFWSAGAVPLVYLYLIFWSLLMVKALALPIGVLIGYRRS